MKVKAVPEAILNPLVTMLQPYAPEITPTKFIKALTNYNEDTTASQQATSKKLMTLQELQDMAGVSYPTILRHVKEGRLTVVKVGRASRVKPEEANRYLGFTG